MTTPSRHAVTNILAVLALLLAVGCDGDGGSSSTPDVVPDTGAQDATGDQTPTPDIPESDTACTKDCTARQCGPDPVCGQSCGMCPIGQECSASGQCEACQPDCTGKVCGNDGCGGTCGACDPVFEQCSTAGQCVAAALDLTCAQTFACIDQCATAADAAACHAQCAAATAAGSTTAVDAVEQCCTDNCAACSTDAEPGACCKTCALDNCGTAHDACFVGTAICPDVFSCALACGCVHEAGCTAAQAFCTAGCLAQGSTVAQDRFWEYWTCRRPACESLDPPIDPYDAACDLEAPMFCQNAFRACFEDL